MRYSKEEQIQYQIDKLKYHFKRLNFLGAIDRAIQELKKEGIGNIEEIQPFADKLKKEKVENNKSNNTSNKGGRFENLEIDQKTSYFLGD